MAFYCPHCDEGPFNVSDWWDHMGTHNAPWLQSRYPKNLERTDLGYGEDLQRTTVPTHDMPNEKDVWNSVSPYGWHEDLTGQPFDGGLSTDPPGTHMGSYDEEGNWIDDPINSPDLNVKFYRARDDQLHEAGHIPFLYTPKSNTLHIMEPSGHHYDLYAPTSSEEHYNGQPHIAGEFVPFDYGSSGFLHYYDIPPENVRRFIEDRYSDAPINYKGGYLPRLAAQTIPDAPVTPTPQAHKMVWLSQPNNASLKYWHHNPSNTTYAWDFWGKNNDDPRHHWEMARHLDIRRDNGDTPLSPHGGGLNDWEGGFFTQNSGKHPADIWGLPSSVDYAQIQGDGDYGNSVW